MKDLRTNPKCRQRNKKMKNVKDTNRYRKGNEKTYKHIGLKTKNSRGKGGGEYLKR